jgi:hypothetical protein
MMESADFVFIKSGNVYVIEKDRFGILFFAYAITEEDVEYFLRSNYKTKIVNMRGDVIMKNFSDKEKKYDLTNVHNLLSEVEEGYNAKQKLLEDIDNALAEGNREEFLRLTNQLNEVS